MLRGLAGVIIAVTTPHPVRVAVDGRPASGKTTLANELGDLLSARGRHVIRATIDEFMYPKAMRYRRGVDSPEGCYHDSLDFDALHGALLDPLGPGGSRTYRTATYDRDTDRVVALRRLLQSTPCCSSMASFLCGLNSTTAGTCASSCRLLSKRR